MPYVKYEISRIYKSRLQAWLAASDQQFCVIILYATVLRMILCDRSFFFIRLKMKEREDHINAVWGYLNGFIISSRIPFVDINNPQLPLKYDNLASVMWG